MRTPPPPIPQFTLSPLAHAGVLVSKLCDLPLAAGHAVTVPHRDAHYLLLLSTRGRCTLALDFERVEVAAPALALVLPDQVHQFLDSRDLQGWGVSFDPVLLDDGFRQVLAHGGRGLWALGPHPAFCRAAVGLLKLLADVQAAPPDAYTGSTAHALLTALLGRLAGQLLAAPEAALQARESRGAHIEQAFGELLRQHFKEWKQPARYAAALAVSVAHLTDTLKDRTGRSASAHIQQRGLLEAKRLLYFTDLSVREVGYAVGYDEPVYFGKLFRRATGTTPQRFRQQFRD